jgi:hypothetical protein
MQISIINDCFDENARLRQISRAGALFLNAGVSCFASNSELEAAGFLVDAIDAFEGREGIIMANIAPRNGSAKKWNNGTPFGFFWYNKTLIISSVDGLVLSLCKKLSLLGEFYLLDIADTMDFIGDEELDKNTRQRIIKTQFRSYNFLPRAADWLWRGYNLPKEKYNIDKIKDAPEAIWFIDNFGNIKTTLLAENYHYGNGEELSVAVNGKNQKIEFYERLKDIPDKTIGLVEGSSGVGDKRFLEIIFQGGNAAQKLGLKNGDSVEI